MPHARLALLALLAVAAAPLTSADALDDPDGDATGALDAVEVAWSIGNSTVTLEVRFEAGDAGADRAVRGILFIGAPGGADPTEWYQVTILANDTYAYAGHAGPLPADIVATSWTGDLARVELRRESMAVEVPCAFAVVEAGTLTDDGFTRSDVAPTGFVSPEEAWPVDQCPEPHAQAAADEEKDDKGSPGLALPMVLAALILVLLVRRR